LRRLAFEDAQGRKAVLDLLEGGQHRLQARRHN
jgi:hypothetical protein